MRTFVRNIIKYRWQYAMCMVGIVFLIIFSYVPMVGLQVAFRNYRIGNTMWNARWVGLKNFWFLEDPEFWRIVKNTIALSGWRFAVNFPAPIILALLINEVRNTRFKRIVQSITYIPHFISWIVVAYILESFLSPYDGIINNFIVALGGKPIFFMGKQEYFVPMVTLASLWKEVGWGTIIYLAAITTIDPQLYEAARIDGAGKMKQLRYITIPCIRPTIVLLLILQLPNLLNTGIDAVYPLQNNANLEVSTVLDTYVLNNGLQLGKYSLASAIGLVSSVVSFILIITANTLANKISGEGLW